GYGYYNGHADSHSYCYCNRHRNGHAYPNAETYAYTTISTDTEASTQSRTPTVAVMQGKRHCHSVASVDTANRRFQFQIAVGLLSLEAPAYPFVAKLHRCQGSESTRDLAGSEPDWH